MPRPRHFEIPADDPESLAAFYRALFGWRIERLPGWDYWHCKTGDGPGIDGALTKKSLQTGVINNVTVDDIDAYLANVVQLGGKIVVPRSAVEGMGWYALAHDPEGNPVGFWQEDAFAVTQEL